MANKLSAAQKSLDPLQAIYQLIDIISRAGAIEKIYDEALNALQRSLSVDRSAILLFDPDGVMRFKAWRGLSDKYRAAVEGHTPWSPGEKDPQPLLISDVEKELDSATLRPVILSEGIRAMGFIPLVSRGRLIGKFMVYYNAPHQFSAEEVQLARTIGNHIAFAIESKRAEEFQTGQARQAALRADVSVALAAGGSLRQILQHCVEAIVEHLGVAFARIWLLDEEKKTLKLQASAGMYTHLDGPHSRIPVGALKIGLIAQERRPHLTNDLLNDPRIRDKDWVRREGMKAFAGYPLLVDDRLVGVLGMFSTAPLPDDTLAAIALIAEAIAQGIERKRIEQEREELLRRERAARAEAEAASQAKDEFLATVSHELRTPLTPLLGWIQMLEGRQVDRETLAYALESIKRNARAQAQLVEDILDVSRIITGKLRLQVQPVKLSEVIEAAVETVRPAAEAKNIAIEVVLTPAVGTVHGDPNRLQQVVWNLLSNAIKFTPGEGHIEVRLAPAGANAQITVKDTGQGISKEFLPYVFDRFRQADSSYSRMHGGLGLGLALVRHLVEMHGGTVRAESEGEDRGAAFTVTIPTGGSEPITVQPPALSQSGPESPMALQGLRLLVVDDDADTLEMLRVMLEQYGAGVQVALSTPEALDILRREEVDVIVSDIGMPGDDGYALIREIRLLELDANEHTPAIALTAYAGSKDRRRALAAGYDEHLSKPIGQAELIALIARMAGRRAS